MFNQKYFGIPVWVWMIVLAIILFTSYQTISKKIVQEESKEAFSAVEPIKIYNFNTSWCGWSIRFQKPWTDFTEYVNDTANNLSNIQAIDVKCDNSDNSDNKDNKVNEEMCKSYNVPGYPYVIVEQGDKRTPYQGERTAEALIAFAKTL